jgi:hypothetical protein
MSDELPERIAKRIATISDEELEFRGRTREGMRQNWRQRIERDKGSPRIGEEAPEFELERLSPAGMRTGETVKLTSLRGRPVGLIFGSFT